VLLTAITPNRLADGTLSLSRHYSAKSLKMRTKLMKIVFAAGALAVAACLVSPPAGAQDQADEASYEMASLDRSVEASHSTAIPLPTPRPDLAQALGSATIAAQPAEIRRTAEGYRIVGPRFFPED
jgi:hypothetical protein